MEKKINFLFLLLFLPVLIYAQSPVIQWQKSFGGSNFDQAKAMQSTADGGYILAGSSNSINGDVTGNHGSSDFWVVKTDAAGTLTWQKSLGGTNDEEVHAVFQHLDQTYLVAGSAKSGNGDLTVHF